MERDFESSWRDLQDLHTIAPLESDRKTMKSASGKRPPDEAHGPGKEAIRPQQRCLGKSRKEGAQCTLARCSNSGSRNCADSKGKACDARHGARVVQIELLHRSDFKKSAKIRQTCSHLCSFIFKINLFFTIVVQSSPRLMKNFRNHYDSNFYGKNTIS